MRTAPPVQSSTGARALDVMSRPRVRGTFNSNNFDLYPSNTSLGWRVVRKVTYAKGMEKCALGLWRKVYDEQHNHVGFQIGAYDDCSNVVGSRPTPTAIARFEMEINALSKSRTAHLCEDQRVSRSNRQTGKALPPEDRAERVQAKVRVWPEVEARKQDILRVWPKK